MKLNSKKPLTAWAVLDSRGHIGGDDDNPLLRVYRSKKEAKYTWQGLEGVEFVKIKIK